jgi:hypothetical protein
MSNYCCRCNQTHPMDRMLTVVNTWGRWEDVCEGRVTLSDRVIDTMYDEEEFGPDSAQQLLERGPR